MQRWSSGPALQIDFTQSLQPTGGFFCVWRAPRQQGSISRPLRRKAQGCRAKASTRTLMEVPTSPESAAFHLIALGIQKHIFTHQKYKFIFAQVEFGAILIAILDSSWTMTKPKHG